ITAGWVTLLAIPRFVSASGAHDYVAAWAELIQIVLLETLAYLSGARVTAEREARLLAESAREAHLGAEALYRDLFDSNQARSPTPPQRGFMVRRSLRTGRSAPETDRHPTASAWSP